MSLGLEGFFLVCRSTLEKATFMCCSTVLSWKYLCGFIAVSLSLTLGGAGEQATLRYTSTHLVLKNMSVLSSVLGE